MKEGCEDEPMPRRGQDTTRLIALKDLKNLSLRRVNEEARKAKVGVRSPPSMNPCPRRTIAIRLVELNDLNLIAADEQEKSGWCHRGPEDERVS